MSQEKSGPGRNPKDPAEKRPIPEPSSENKPIVTPPPGAHQTPMPGQGNRPDPFDPKKQNAPKEDLVGATADEEEEEEQEE